MKKNIILFWAYFFFSLPLFAQNALDDIRFSVSEYQIIGDNPLGDQAYAVLVPFTGEQYGLEGLSAAADALEQSLKKQGYSFHRVNVPPQELFSGSVILEIVQFKIGQVAVTGNKFYDEANILNSIQAIKKDEAPNTYELSQSVKQANMNAFKSVVLSFKEGEEADTIDAELKVTDRDPTMYFLSLDNTGGQDSESSRLTLGFQNGNLFNKDHALTATLTTSPEDTEAATQFGLNYQIPLYPLASRLGFLLSSSESNSGTVADNDLVTGKGTVFGVTYSQAIFRTSDFDQNLTVGLIYKLFDNENVGFNSELLSFPLELGYNFSKKGRQSVFSGGVSVATNIETGAKNTDDDYNASRNGATSSWRAVRYHLSMDYLFHKEWLFHANLVGQSSSDRLISGEQFGVGGSSTLRGFEQRSINGDEGYFYRLELWGPSISSYGVRWLVFSDQAYVKLKGSTLDDDFASVGFGLRWTWKQNLNLNLDVGLITKGGGLDPTVNQDDDNKAHFSLVYRF